MSNIGDIVRLKSGQAPILVCNIRGTYVEGVYAFSLSSTHFPQTRFVEFTSDVHVIHPDAEMSLYARLHQLTQLPDQGGHSVFHPKTIRTAASVAIGRIEKSLPNKEHEEMLYQTKEETPRFGTKLAINRKGEIVLDLKDGSVEAFKADMLEEVVPYTVRLKAIEGSKHTLDLQVAEGTLAEGDLIFRNSAMYRVVKLDTKDRNAEPLKKAYRIPVEPIEFGGSDVLENEA